jgi:hypothetical protein
MFYLFFFLYFNKTKFLNHPNLEMVQVIEHENAASNKAELISNKRTTYYNEGMDERNSTLLLNDFDIEKKTEILQKIRLLYEKKELLTFLENKDFPTISKRIQIENFNIKTNGPSSKYKTDLYGGSVKDEINEFLQNN